MKIFMVQYVLVVYMLCKLCFRMGPKRVIGPEERERRKIKCKEYRERMKVEDPTWSSRQVERTKVKLLMTFI